MRTQPVALLTLLAPVFLLAGGAAMADQAADDAPATLERAAPAVEPVPTLEDPFADPSGVFLGFGLGANLCVVDSTADCGGLDPSVALEGSLGYRFGRWFSAALDVDYGSYGTTGFGDGGSASSLAVAPMLRVHLPASDRFELSLGAGIGYATWRASDGDDAVSWSALGAYRLTFAASFRVLPDLAVGVASSFVGQPDIGAFCGPDGTGRSACRDASGRFNVAERATVTVEARYRFR